VFKSKLLLHIHSLLGNVLVKKLLGYATIEEAVFSMSSAPSNSRTKVLCNPFLSNGTVNTSIITGAFRCVCAECLKENWIQMQRSHFRVRVPEESWAYFALLDSRLPFSSSPTTRRAIVEVFDPDSTRETVLASNQSQSQSYMLRPTVQSAGLSWNKAPIWGFYYCQTVAGLLM
jgi:hypothetical protein